jgi:NAD(P)-dependent dehydrogenase (short-subunit alcohol dehydrogenase family)
MSDATQCMPSAAELFSLAGKVALVTGSSRGIGRAIAELMASAGARVVISSRKPEACDRVAEGIRAAGGEALARPCNVSRDDEVEALVAGVEAHWGRIDVLVLNAAVNPYMGPLLEIDAAAWRKTLDTNVGGVLQFCRRVVPGMARRRDGAVIIVSSIAGLKGSAALGAYAVSKAADMQLARNLAVEWGHANVRVNCIAPGLVRTDMARALWDDPERLATALRGYPIGRIGEPGDIAGAALYLASPAGAFVTGQTLVVDGGSTIHAGYS